MGSCISNELGPEIRDSELRRALVQFYVHFHFQISIRGVRENQRNSALQSQSDYSCVPNAPVQIDPAAGDQHMADKID